MLQPERKRGQTKIDSPKDSFLGTKKGNSSIENVGIVDCVWTEYFVNVIYNIQLILGTQVRKAINFRPVECVNFHPN